MRMQGPESESDLELEVTRLRDGETASDAPDESTVAQTPLAGSHPSARSWRRIRTAFVVGIVLLALVVVALVNPAVQSSIAAMLHPSSGPAPTLVADANMVFLVGGAPWATYSLDAGKPTPLSRTDQRLSSTWLRLAPGRHTIQVTQTPFPALKCTISVPAAHADTCPMTNTAYLAGPEPNARTIDLGAHFDRLPPGTASALMDAVRAILPQVSQPMAIAPGEHYLRDDGSVAVARTPLEIALRLELTSVEDDIGNGVVWSPVAVAQGSWHVTTPTGEVIADAAPLWPADPLYTVVPPETRNLRLQLAVDWDGAWHILQRADFTFGAPALSSVANPMVSALLSTTPQVGISSVSWQDGQGTSAGQGCVVSLLPRDPSDTTPLVLYYHFGALLAVNDAAHRAFPALPVAIAIERAQARAIMGHP